MFDLSQKSTQYGILILIIAAIMIIGWWTGKDLQPLTAAVGALVGAYGVLKNDNPN